MNRIEKFTIGAVLIAIIASFTLYGVWEDKVWLFAPLLILIFIALAVWGISGFKFRVSDFQTPPGGVWLLLFWLYSASMIPFSVIPYEAKISTLRVGAYLSVYWATANILSRFSRRKAVLMTVFLILILTALYSLVQHKVAPLRM